MDRHYRDIRKIDPSRDGPLADGSANDMDRMEVGPTILAYDEWAAAGLRLPDQARMREYRWKRLVRFIQARDYGGLLLFDPLNIRYATDSTNMQLWNTHNPFRAVLVCADGYMVIWDYKNAVFLSEFNPLVRKRRSGANLFYFDRGDRLDEAADIYVNEVRELIERHCGTNKRLAVDKIMIHGLRNLEAQGFEVFPGEELTARAIKGVDEILAMCCAVHACEKAVGEMERAARAGIPSGKMSEDDVWSVLHAENIRPGGEWIDPPPADVGPAHQFMVPGMRPRTVQENEILAFDTDLIGSYRMCIDISRTWWIGPDKLSSEMVYAMCHAREHITTNMELLAPGVRFRDLVFGGHQLDAQLQKQKYGAKMHGAGLCDEWPLVTYPDRFDDGAFEYVLESGMVMYVEALVSPEGGNFSIKLENQVLITETGHENLTGYPFDPVLMGE